MSESTGASDGEAPTYNPHVTVPESDEELLSLTALDDPDWAVVKVDHTGLHTVEVAAHTYEHAQVLATALNQGRLLGEPSDNHYVPVPTTKLHVL